MNRSCLLLPKAAAAARGCRAISKQLISRHRPRPAHLHTSAKSSDSSTALCRCTGVAAASTPVSILSWHHQLIAARRRTITWITALNDTRQMSTTATVSDDQQKNDSTHDNDSDDDVSYLVSNYEQMCRQDGGTATRDEHQIRALTELDRLRFQLIKRYGGGDSGSATSDDELGGGSAATIGNDEERESFNPFGGGGGFFGKLFSSSPVQAISTSLKAQPPRGVYLHGGVGCGKTFCMDLFYNSIVSTDTATRLSIKAQKVHFHSFMLNKVHKQMHEAKMVEGIKGDVLPRVIELILEDGHVICFDEFQVTDVADALILRRLFTGLIEQGAIIVATSNRPPRDLYLNGLQRDRFLPFIDLLEEKLNVVSMWESETDYRLIQGESAAKGVYFVGESNRADFDEVFQTLTKGERVGRTSLTTQGRRVPVPLASLEVGVARFNFDDLCRKALGAADYIVIGENFHTVFVDGVPSLTLNDINVVRRLITFIDCMYEAHVKLILQLETLPKDIFLVDLDNAHHDEFFSFDRARSRLDEMGSIEYLKKRWVGRSKAEQTEEMAHELEFLAEEEDGVVSEKGHKKGRHLYRHAKDKRV